jgi:hypothetical protein
LYFSIGVHLWQNNMHTIAEPWLASYIRAWERHQIHFSLHPPLSLDADRLPELPVRAEKLPPEIPVAVAVSGGPLTYRFSYAHCDRTKRGERNESFLNPGMLQDILLPAIEALAPGTHLVMLCLAPVYATENVPADIFLEKLDRFLAGLPRSCRYAVGVKNPELLLPDYCACLRSHGVAHLFDETAMPPLLDQIQIPGILTAEHVVYRNMPAPYAGRSTDGEWALGIVETIRRCLTEKRRCFLYLDEQTSEASLGMLMTMLNADLAKLSLLRKRAA